MGDSRRCAIATLFQLEKRFAKNQKLGIEYSKFIREGIGLGNMQYARSVHARCVGPLYAALLRVQRFDNIGSSRCVQWITEDIEF